MQIMDVMFVIMVKHNNIVDVVVGKTLVYLVGGNVKHIFVMT
jgi:hypothetical protein